MGTVAVDDFDYGTRAGAAGGTTMLSMFEIKKFENKETNKQ